MGGATTSGGHESVLAEIQRRMATVDLATATPPPWAVGEKDHVVGKATDEIKRLAATVHTIVGQHNTLVSEANKLLEEIQGAMTRSGLGALHRLFAGKFHEHEQRAARLEEIQTEIDQLHGLRKVVTGMLWLEVESTFPELQSKRNSSIRSDWKICWSEECDDIPDFISDLLGQNQNMPEELKDLLRHASEQMRAADRSRRR